MKKLFKIALLLGCVSMVGLQIQPLQAAGNVKDVMTKYFGQSKSVSPLRLGGGRE